MRNFAALLTLALLVGFFVFGGPLCSGGPTATTGAQSGTAAAARTTAAAGSPASGNGSRYISGGTFDLRAYYAGHRGQSAGAFLQQFPYGAYLQVVEFTDFTTLQAHRRFLYEKKRIGDAFLYHLADRFHQLYPPRQAHLRRFLTIGEAYLDPSNKQFHANGYVNRRLSEIYRTIGYFLLGRAAAFLQGEIEAGRWDPTGTAAQDLLDRMAESRVYVSYEKPTWQKLRHHAGQGNLGYIARRGWNKASEKVGALVPDRVAGFFGGADDGSAPTQALTLNGQRQYAPLSGGTDHGVHLFEVERGGAPVGHAVWLRRPHVQGDYLAHRKNGQSVTQRYGHWKNRHRTVLAMSGGFTNSAGQPEGLTIEDGETVNAVIMPDRDGLVFFGPGGGLRVADLRRGAFTLPRAGGGNTRQLRPLDRLTDYAALVNWCRERNATVFQTQLLAFADSMRIDPAKAPSELRERRLLALARAGDGSLSHIVFDLTTQTALADAAQQIFDTLRARGLKVEAILNLDVGSHNILRVYGPGGQRWAAPAGPVSLQRATNLIVYSR